MQLLISDFFVETIKKCFDYWRFYPICSISKLTTGISKLTK